MSNPKVDLAEHRQRMEAGALSPLVQQFANDLATLGHSPLTVLNYSDSARHFADWLGRSGIALPDLDDGVVERFAHHPCQCPGYRRDDHLSKRYVNRARRFIRFLREHGIVQVASPRVDAPVNSRIAAFRWQRHRWTD